MNLAIAAQKARDWTEKRDTLIAEAVQDGESLRSVAARCGLSHTAVKNIADRVRT